MRPDFEKGCPASGMWMQVRPVAERAWQLPVDTMPAIQGAALVAAGLLQVICLSSLFPSLAPLRAVPWPCCASSMISTTCKGKRCEYMDAQPPELMLFKVIMVLVLQLSSSVSHVQAETFQPAHDNCTALLQDRAGDIAWMCLCQDVQRSTFALIRWPVRQQADHLDQIGLTSRHGLFLGCLASGAQHYFCT